MLKQPVDLDSLFQALADPSRRQMVERLSGGPASVSELAGPLEMSLAAVMQHLAVLERSGLVQSEKIGRVRTVRIEPGALSRAEGWIAERRSMWEKNFDRLGALLDEEAAADAAALEASVGWSKPTASSTGAGTTANTNANTDTNTAANTDTDTDTDTELE